MRSNANNQGIAHIARKAGGLPICGNHRGHLSFAIPDYRSQAINDYAFPPTWCRQCVAKLAASDAKFTAAWGIPATR